MNKKGFDADKYLEEQARFILERINEGDSERLYLEFGGKLVQDKHAMRVLPEPPNGSSTIVPVMDEFMIGYARSAIGFMVG